MIFSNLKTLPNLILITQKCKLSSRFILPSGQVWLKNRYQNFVDSIRITVAGGAGGNGHPKNQGLGGNGGNVCLVAKSKVKLRELNKTQKKFIAENGQHSSNYAIIGRNGKDLEIKVPVGVSVILDELKKEIGELNEENDRLVVAFGGRGGDKLNSYCGTKGQKLTIRIDLKLLADVGLVGYPNAGKSTLLRALSRASPKIASYPFTTITPNLGVIEYDPPKSIQIYENHRAKAEIEKLPKYYEKDFRRITVADLPGLIDGAHRNIGLGHKFLKHIVRTNCLLFVVDIDGFKNVGGKHYHESWVSQEPIEVIQSLVNEIDLYDSMILQNKPTILAISKLDNSEKRKQFHELIEKLKQTNITVPSIIERRCQKKAAMEIIDNNNTQQQQNNKEVNDTSNININPDNDPYVYPGAQESKKDEERFKFDKIIGISSIEKYNIERLKGMIRKLIDLQAEYKLVGDGEESNISFKKLLARQQELLSDESDNDDETSSKHKITSNSL